MPLKGTSGLWVLDVRSLPCSSHFQGLWENNRLSNLAFHIPAGGKSVSKACKGSSTATDVQSEGTAMFDVGSQVFACVCVCKLAGSWWELHLMTAALLIMRLQIMPWLLLLSLLNHPYPCLLESDRIVLWGPDRVTQETLNSAFLRVCDWTLAGVHLSALGFRSSPFPDLRELLETSVVSEDIDWLSRWWWAWGRWGGNELNLTRGHRQAAAHTHTARIFFIQAPMHKDLCR